MVCSNRLLTALWLCALSSLSAEPLPLTPRAHLNAETQAVHDRLLADDGWNVGLGSLVAQRPGERWPTLDYPHVLARWSELYPEVKPAWYEFELGDVGRGTYVRDWDSAKALAEAGGLPWFRIQLHNFAYPLGPRPEGTFQDRRGGLAPVLPGGAHHDEFMACMRQVAGEFKAFGRPCVFRFFHEMNGRWFWWGGQPEAYQRVWKLVFELFRSEGVDNVIWCWAPSSTTPGAVACYPGDGTVDLIGGSLYCDSPKLPDEVHAYYAEMAHLAPTKPLVITELGPLARTDFWQAAPNEFASLPHFRGALLWLARGWKAWGKDPERGSLIDETSPADQRKAFEAFRADPRVRWLGSGRPE